MTFSDSELDFRSSLSWQTYRVNRTRKARLLEFVLQGLRMRNCQILHSSQPDRAPFFIVFETQSGERHGVLVYAFLANSVLTKNRPSDEHRFQVKYGSDLKNGVLEVAIDPHLLVTTIFVGIDLERGVLVSADPLLNTPAPMSRSIEFKSAQVENVLDTGWAAWERERRPGKSKSRPTVDLEDTRTEVLLGARQDRLLDVITFERIARGLDPGERNLIADRMADVRPVADLVPHELLDELGVPPETLFDLIQGAGRLKMAVRGWVAEQHLFDLLSKMPEVSSCVRIEEDGQPDIRLRWKNGNPLFVECKNTLRKTYADGVAKVDFQKTRASKGDPCSRYYRATDFQILAACLHSVTERWEFQYALTSKLPPHSECTGRLSTNLRVEKPVFTDRPNLLFDICSGVV
jgi:Methylase-associated X1